jgi:drug/metabolite transporter (DMT)-like permease
MNRDEKPTARTYLSIIATVILWGSSYSAVRYALGISDNIIGYSPSSVALLRFLIASIVAIGYLVVTRAGLPRIKDIPLIFCASFLGISTYHVLNNFGAATISSGAAAALVACSPVFVALMSAAFLKERLNLWGWAGVLLSFLGIAIIGFLHSDGFVFDIHALALVACALVTAIFFMLTKQLLNRYSGMQFTCYSFIVGVIPLMVFFPGLLRELPKASVGASLAVVYLALCPGVIGYALWNYALTKMVPTKQAVFLKTAPLVALIIGWLWLGEKATALILLGGVIVIAGVLLVQLVGARRQSESS